MTNGALLSVELGTRDEIVFSGRNRTLEILTVVADCTVDGTRSPFFEWEIAVVGSRIDPAVLHDENEPNRSRDQRYNDAE